jgi:pimeloyl-ACP methyl ester carboxylesterase
MPLSKGRTRVRLGELFADISGAGDDRPPVVLLHGLTFDRRQWGPLADLLDGRRAVALDLPGHGESPRRGSYDLADVAEVVHQSLEVAEVRRPVLVGHSIGGVLATVYAAKHPARAVLNIDQPLLAGRFGNLLRTSEPVLRGPDYLQVWKKLLAGMNIDQLPPDLQRLVYSTPRQDLLLGYWREILEKSSDELRERRTRELAALRSAGTTYHHVSRAELDPGYQQWLTSALPEAAFTVLPGSGHFPHLAQPGALAEIVAGWS